MALKVESACRTSRSGHRPACVITNTEQRTKLLIEGERILILREKDILTPADRQHAGMKRCLSGGMQLMYLAPDPMIHHPTYFQPGAWIS